MTLPTPPYTAVTDRLTSVDRDLVKGELGITGDALNDRLDRWIATAKDDADRYLNNPFIKRSSSAPYDYIDPPVNVAIPGAVTDYIVDWCAFMVGGASRTGIVRSERTRDLARTYQTPDAARSGLQRLHLRRYRLLPGLAPDRLGATWSDPKVA